jgi:hypothetical protein
MFICLFNAVKSKDIDRLLEYCYFNKLRFICLFMNKIQQYLLFSKMAKSNEVFIRLHIAYK